VPPAIEHTERWLALAIGLALASFAFDASAHGSRLVPVEDQPAPPATAPPVPSSAPPPPTSRGASPWSGLHVGGHVAYGLAQAGDTLSASTPTRSSDSLGSFSGGVQIGYDRRLPSHVLLGVEGDIAFPYFVQDGAVVSRNAAQASVTGKLDFVSTVRARVGYALDRWVFYATGGLASAQTRMSETGASGATTTVLSMPVGWAAGAGAEFGFAPGWTLRAQYLLDRPGDTNGAFAPGSRFQLSGTTLQSLQLGLDWHFGSPDGADDGWPIAADDWNVHWQSTFIEQGYFGFRSSYEGPNSLSGSTQFTNTLSATAFVGLRLWQGAQFYFDPEVDQGFGLSQTLGMAAFPNGEAQKASYPVPRLNIDRVVLRQTFGLGGEQAHVEDGPNQLPGRRDVSRITLTAGRLSVGDGFGLNAYAQDPRTQFLNWNIYGGGSYDWTMDKPGFTWGAFAELNQKRWAVRAGYFLETTESNGNSFDLNVPTRGQYLVEPELRYLLFSRPGVLRVMAWATRAVMGSYSEALAMPVTTGGYPGGYPDIAQTRQVRLTYGFVANVEQAVTRDLGVFSRASWTPGLVEVMGWTDCDESLSLGLLLTGNLWRRPDDQLGLAGVVEGLSPEARAYFAAGGMGIVIGDGRLDYRPERVAEAYYAFGLTPWATLTIDTQVVVNPAYNADRGPVPIYAMRLHVER
jgi:high affinity Mn2+ porin